MGSNVGEILKNREEFELQCKFTIQNHQFFAEFYLIFIIKNLGNRKLSNEKKIVKFCDETLNIGAFYFYKRGDMFSKIIEKNKPIKPNLSDFSSEIFPTEFKENITEDAKNKDNGKHDMFLN